MDTKINLQTLVSGTVFAMAFSCGGENLDSPVKITNGIVISDATYPAVVNLDITSTYGTGKCTGTFVNDYQVLTAAHCVDGIRSAATMLDNRTVYAKSYSVHQDYSWLPEDEKASADLAVLNFPRSTSSNFIPLANSAPASGDHIRIVGFGNTKVHKTIDYTISSRGAIYSEGLTTSGADGQKRYGDNTLDRRENGELVFVGEFDTQWGKQGHNAAAAQGDSGGPMLVYSPNGWEIVGVTSMGRVKDKTFSEERSFWGSVNGKINIGYVETVYVDLSSDRAASYLKQSLELPE